MPEMLDGPSTSQLAGGLVWETVASSWLGGTWLANVPISSGSVTWSKRRQVPGSIEFNVPRSHEGTDWLPGGDSGHPLARFGQELVVTLRVTALVSQRRWNVPLGRFLIADWRDQIGNVAVTGVSMFQRVEERRLTSPRPSRAAGTLKSELRRLLPASLGLVVDGDLTDRTCPSMSWGESRVDAVREIAKAWPARLMEDRYGNALALPPLDEVPTPLDTLTDGTGGTVVSAPRQDTREGTYNVVVARGQDSSDSGIPNIQAVAEQPTGPLRARGEYGYVPTFFQSPLITSRASASAAAWSLLGDAIRPSRTVPVTLAPDPRWELDDAVEIITQDDRIWGYVSGLQIPLTVGDGDMVMDVEVPT